ncbi:MAG: universal stress protein [Roseobacter sp.]
MFNIICVGYDGSTPSDNAVHMACDLAEKYGSVVHIVHTPIAETVTFALGAVSGYHVATTMPSKEDTVKAAQVMLEKAQEVAQAFGDISVMTHVGEGDPAHALTEYAKGAGSDLIVTGRRGLGNLSGLLLGSTSQSVARLAECAHLTVT